MMVQKFLTNLPHNRRNVRLKFFVRFFKCYSVVCFLRQDGYPFEDYIVFHCLKIVIVGFCIC